MSDHHTHNAIRRIVLPSGRAIEVIRFNEDAATRDLHVCPSCESDLVQPLSWSESADNHWQLTLECPNCGWSESGLYDRIAVERFEDRLDEGLADMISDLQRLTLANMAADVDCFISALEADMILPEDF